MNSWWTKWIKTRLLPSYIHKRIQTAKIIRDMAIGKEAITQFVRAEAATREILEQESQNVMDSKLWSFAKRKERSSRGTVASI